MLTHSGVFLMYEDLVCADALTEEQVSGAFVNLKDILNLFKSGVAWKFPGDKAKMVVFIRAGADWLKTVADAPFNVDDIVIDKIADIVLLYLDSQQTNPPVPGLLVGAEGDLPESMYDLPKMQSFVVGFSDAEMPTEARQKLLANPKALKAISRLSRENQVKLFARGDLLDLIIKYGPIILRIIMLFL